MKHVVALGVSLVVSSVILVFGGWPATALAAPATQKESTTKVTSMARKESAVPASPAEKPSTTSCQSCLELQKITKEHVTEAGKSSPDFVALGLKAADVVNEAGKKSKLTAEQIHAFVEVLRVNVPFDPSHTLVEDTIEVILKNRAEIESAIKALPKREATPLLDAIFVAAKSVDRGQDF